MTNKKDLTIEKEAIIAEYLGGGITLRKLEEKYNIPHETLHVWILKHQGRYTKRVGKGIKKVKKVVTEQVEVLPKEVKQLQGELRKAKLYNALLVEMIDIAEKDLGLAIRKKSGTKQS